MNDFVSMPNDEINRYMKMEKLLENKISRRFKVRRLEINDFGYLMEHLYIHTRINGECELLLLEIEDFAGRKIKLSCISSLMWCVYRLTVWTN